jgi:C-terminal processing protease CtpA/Prc
MILIENNMQVYFKNEKDNKIQIQSQTEYIKKNEPIQMQVFEDEIKPNKNLPLPFAFVGLISEGSPAEEAGLQVGDGIVSFADLYYGMTNNPLQRIAIIVRDKVNSEILVEVLRKTNENGEEKLNFIKLTLIPHTWSGQGLLG